MSEPKRFAVIRKYKKQDNFQILEWFHTIKQCKDFLIKQEMSDEFDLEIMKYGDMSKEKEIGGYQPIASGKDPEPPPDDPSGLREEREAKEYMSNSPAPGTCCPDKKIENGICLGCGSTDSEARGQYYKIRDNLNDIPQTANIVINISHNYIKELQGIQRQLLSLIARCCDKYIHNERDKDFIRNIAKEIIGRK